MVKKVGIAAGINAPVGIEEAHMTMENLAVAEGGGQHPQKLLLPPCKFQRISWIDRREIGIQHGIGPSSDRYGSLFIIHSRKQEPVLHPILRMAHDHSSFHLELNDSDCGCASAQA